MTLLGVLKTRERTLHNKVKHLLFWVFTEVGPNVFQKTNKAKTGTVENHAEVTIAAPDFWSILKAISRACERENERENSP